MALIVFGPCDLSGSARHSSAHATDLARMTKRYGGVTAIIDVLAHVDVSRFVGFKGGSNPSETLLRAK